MGNLLAFLLKDACRDRKAYYFLENISKVEFKQQSGLKKVCKHNSTGKVTWNQLILDKEGAAIFGREPSHLVVKLTGGRKFFEI